MGAALLALILAAPPAPGPTTFRNVSDEVAPSLLHLVCGNGHTASGVIVGGAGQVLAPAKFCSAEAVVAAREGGATLNARRVKSSADLGVALYQLPPGSYPAAPIGDARAVQQGSWIVAVALGEKGRQHAGGMTSARDAKDARIFFTDAPSPAGAGIFSLTGRLVGLAVSTARAHRVKVVAVDALQAWLAGGP